MWLETDWNQENVVVKAVKTGKWAHKETDIHKVSGQMASP